MTSFRSNEEFFQAVADLIEAARHRGDLAYQP